MLICLRRMNLHIKSRMWNSHYIKKNKQTHKKTPTLLSAAPKFTKSLRSHSPSLNSSRKHIPQRSQEVRVKTKVKHFWCFHCIVTVHAELICICSVGHKVFEMFSSTWIKLQSNHWLQKIRKSFGEKGTHPLGLESSSLDKITCNSVWTWWQKNWEWIQHPCTEFEVFI